MKSGTVVTRSEEFAPWPERRILAESNAKKPWGFKRHNPLSAIRTHAEVLHLPDIPASVRQQSLDLLGERVVVVGVPCQAGLKLAIEFKIPRLGHPMCVPRLSCQ